MSTNDSKRFYWLKLKKDFFQQHQIKILKALPNGRLYALIYLELLAESTTHDGELRFSEVLPYDTVTLSAVIDEDVGNVEKAIEVLERLELVEILDDQTIYMREIQKLIGSETGSAQRKKEYRQRIAMTQQIPSKSTRFTPPTLEEVTEYCRERGNNINPKTFYDYFTTGNWTDSKGQKVKNWKQKIITWEKHQPKEKEVDELPTYDTTRNKEISSQEEDEILQMMKGKTND